MKHRSKKDLWLVLLVDAVLTLPFVLALVFAASGNAAASWYLLFVASLILAVTLWLTYPLNYEITESMLIVRSGILRTKIPLAAIVAVYPTDSLWSAATWSLDRLRIDYEQADGRRAFVLVSPENKSEFLDDLAARADGLAVTEKRIERIEPAASDKWLNAGRQSVVDVEGFFNSETASEPAKVELKPKQS